MEITIEKLRKIKELAERGIGGEMKTARAMLESLLEKHGLTISDLESEVKTAREFSIRSKAEHQILVQILFMVAEKPDLFGYKNKPKKLYSNLTDLEYLQIKPLVDFHISQYRKELRKFQKTLLDAYIHKHDLFSHKDSEPDSSDKAPLSYEELKSLLSAMQNLEDVHYRKQLTA
jgi:hypothetical protein